MGAPPEPPRSLPRAVIVLGWVSFFTDASADMIYPLVPAFLLSLGGGATALGWLEGIAESVSAAIKLWAGRAIDRPAHARLDDGAPGRASAPSAPNPKRLVVLGYGISALARPLYALAAAPIHVVLVRVADRVGKGLRGPPRDAMLAAVVDAARRGHAFGFHRMMDNFGGVAGPLLAFVLLRLAEVRLETLFLLSVVPGLASVLIAQVFLKAPPPSVRAPEAHEIHAPPAGEAAAIRELPWRFFLVIAVFTLAASGDLFLMRHLTDLGLHVAYVPIAWVSLQLLKGLFNVPGGRASDRYGRRRVLAIAWLLYAATYLSFGLARSWWAAWLLIVPYALHYGLAEGGQRALLTELAPAAVRGRAFGVLLAIEGIFVLPANVGFGWIFDRRGAMTAFAVAAGCAALAAVLLIALVQPAGTSRTRSS